MADLDSIPLDTISEQAVQSLIYTKINYAVLRAFLLQTDSMEITRYFPTYQITISQKIKA